MKPSHTRLLTMLLVGWPLLSVLANTGRATRWMEDGLTIEQVLGKMLIWALVGMVLSVTLWFPWRRWMADAPLTGWRLLVLLLLCTTLGLGFEGLIRAIEWPVPKMEHASGHMARATWTRAFVPQVAMFSWVAVHYLLDTFERLGVERERSLRAEALATESRLAMLRNELNPHFLFNAMNSIIGVIAEDPARAQQMVRQLAGLLRHTLQGHEASTLGAEVDVALKYLRIEQVRFEERLQVVVQVDDTLNELPLLSMLLQPLVENAVKHGMSEQTLTVTIQAERIGPHLALRVTNPGQLRASSTGVGLRNLRERLQLLHPPGSLQISQVGTEVVAVVTLPLEPT